MPSENQGGREWISRFATNVYSNARSKCSTGENLVITTAVTVLHHLEASRILDLRVGGLGHVSGDKRHFPRGEESGNNFNKVLESRKERQVRDLGKSCGLASIQDSS